MHPNAEYFMGGGLGDERAEESGREGFSGVDGPEGGNGLGALDGRTRGAARRMRGGRGRGEGGGVGGEVE